ncbi:MAG: DUF1223 domain-containing protein [Rhodothalassiaceae bacterium]
MRQMLWAVMILLAAPALAGGRPVVVELFTSQGCGECPPAQALLEDLSAREDVLALTWAVDYWDFMGWRDTFAAPGHAARQRAYNDRFGEPGLYTPEIVIDGRREVVGSQRDAVLAALADAVAAERPDFRIDMSEEGEFCIASLAASRIHRPLQLLAIWYKSRDRVTVTGGRNAGRALGYRNVVKAARVIGVWDGEEMHVRFPLSPPESNDADHLAILLEEGNGGPVHGVAVMALHS